MNVEDWTTGAIKFWLSVALRGVVVGLWVGVLIYLGAAIGKISEAHADSPICEHRGESHAAQQHTTREADSRWHVEHGQLPTCGLDDKKHDAGDEHHNDGPAIPHRDHAGIHCTWHGCG